MLAQSVALATFLVGIATGAGVPVGGIMQMSPLEAGMCIAVEVPVAEGQSVSGLMWYNNDSETTFPEVLVAAGFHGGAPNMADALVLLQDVQGIESDWSQVDFGQDVMSPTDVFYVIFRLPGFVGEQGSGIGPGVGYTEAPEESSVFLSAEGEEWFRMVTDKRLLVDPVYAGSEGGQKSMGGKERPVLMLGAPTVAMETEVEPELEQELPEQTEMLAPYPNPFNPQVTIAYALKEAAEVTISVFDLRGRRVREIRPGLQSAGRYQEVWRGRDDAGQRQASGVYFIRLSAGSYERTSRVMLLK